MDWVAPALPLGLHALAVCEANRMSLFIVLVFGTVTTTAITLNNSFSSIVHIIFTVTNISTMFHTHRLSSLAA